MRTTNVIGFAFALVLGGCQTSEAPWSAEQSSATSQELGAVRGCRSQARDCFQAAMSNADMAACQDALRACLQSIGGDGGGGHFGHSDGGLDFDGSFPEGGFGGGGHGGHGGHWGHGGDDWGGGRGFGGGGACGSDLNDAGLPPPPTGGDDGGGDDGGGGVTPPGDDGGGVTPPPPTNGDGGTTSGNQCLQTLQQCLASTTPPATCAANAEACLAAAQ